MYANYKQEVVDLLKALGTGDPKPFSYINPTKYIQHNLVAEPSRLPILMDTFVRLTKVPVVNLAKNPLLRTWRQQRVRSCLRHALRFARNWVTPNSGSGYIPVAEAQNACPIW